MYRSVRDNVLAFEGDVNGCLAILAVPLLLLMAISKGCGLGPFAEKPPTRWRDLIRPAPAVAPVEPGVAPVVSRSKARAAWDKARGVWRALRDE